MSIQFVNAIAFVQDIEISKRFYADRLGLRIVKDDKVIVFFEGHFVIHQARELTTTVFGREAPEAAQLQGRNNLLLYFETDDLDGVFARLREHVALIHPIKQQAWGQKVFRFYDPDRHIVEIGEPTE